ncbi:hypothetical protein LXA43DRAFT_1153855 [Ganoderma leucocontextum]|nr:hypothetical protein LXA43DRAFT_1153855 [Ganoderma leucocontextum]
MRGGSQYANRPPVSTPPVAGMPPHPWTADDAVRWTQYANVLYAWLGNKGPHPGDPPDGYREHYKISNPHAPCPEDFRGRAPGVEPLPPATNTFQPVPQQAHRKIAHLAGPGVHMSDDAFSSWLTHTSAMNNHLARIAFETTQIVGRASTLNPAPAQVPLQVAAPIAPRAMLPPWRGGVPAAARRGGFGAGFRGGRGSFHGGRGGRQGGRGGGHGLGGFRGGQHGRAGPMHGGGGGGGGGHGGGRGGHQGRAQEVVALVDRIGGSAGLPAHGGDKTDRKRGRKGGQNVNRGEPSSGPGGSGAVDDDETVSLGYSDNERDVEMAGPGGQQVLGGGAFDGMGFCG